MGLGFFRVVLLIEEDHDEVGDVDGERGAEDLLRWWEMQRVKRMAMEAAMPTARRGMGGAVAAERAALEEEDGKALPMTIF